MERAGAASPAWSPNFTGGAAFAFNLSTSVLCGAMVCSYVRVVSVKSSVCAFHDSRTQGVVSRWQPILPYSDTAIL